MEEFSTIHTALQTWDKIQRARGYQETQFHCDTDHITRTVGAITITWPMPPFQSFFNWVINQPGVCLPHLQLEGRVPISYAVSFDEKETEEDSDEDECEEREEDGPKYAPTITVFAHSDKFEKEFNPAHGVSAQTGDNLGISEMREVIAKFQKFLAKNRDAQIVHLNLLVYCHVTSPSEKFLQKFFARYRHRHRLITTIFSMQKDLQWFKLDHKLILPHQIMSEQEVDDELRKDGIDVTHLPHIRTSDPVAQLLALRPGVIVRIKVPLDSLEDTVYRIVVESAEAGTSEDDVAQEEENCNDEST
jgi:DNA-directed RNA polymerase subunit H (RpoH/RPB5)